METKDLNSNDKGYLYDMLKAFSKVPVEEQEIEGEVKGYYSSKENLIVIKNTLSQDDKAAVLIHEIAHSLYDDFDYSKERDLSEVFVESVACIVANHLGLDTAPCSHSYIIKWAKGDTKKVLDLGDKIQKSASDFIEKLQNYQQQDMKKIA